MDTTQTMMGACAEPFPIPRDKLVRSVVLPGVIVALAAVVGVDSAGAASADRSHKTAAVATRAVGLSGVGSLARAPALIGAAGALVILLLIGRQMLSITPRLALGGLIPSAKHARPVWLLQRKNSISYHFGGLYGP